MPRFQFHDFANEDLFDAIAMLADFIGEDETHQVAKTITESKKVCSSVLLPQAALWRTFSGFLNSSPPPLSSRC